jgi:hypothetical protein
MLTELHLDNNNFEGMFGPGYISRNVCYWKTNEKNKIKRALQMIYFYFFIFLKVIV